MRSTARSRTSFTVRGADDEGGIDSRADTDFCQSNQLFGRQIEGLLMRKNLLGTITGADTVQRNPEIPATTTSTRADYAMRGASGAMRRSLDEIVEASQRIMDGETIISLDPALIDQSPVLDRIQQDDEEYAALRDLIREFWARYPDPSSSSSSRRRALHRRIRPPAAEGCARARPTGQSGCQIDGRHDSHCCARAGECRAF